MEDDFPTSGFSQRWKNFPDYIIGVTKDIWEDRGIHTLTETYGPDIPVRSPASVVVGNDNVIAATMATLAEFPDRQLYGEDVIWSRDPGSDYFLSSHRLLSTATHDGDGVYGKATRKVLTYRILADCAAHKDVIDDEWLIRDQGAIVRQLGWTPEAFAADLITREGGVEACVKPLTPETDVEGPYRGRGNDNEWGERTADVLERLMAGEISVIQRHYDRAAQLHYPGHKQDYSHVGADKFWLGLRAAFPHAEFKIEHVIGREDPNMPPRAAVRWSLWGKHSGWGAFGTPTGAMVYVLGITHVEYGPYAAPGSGEATSIRREWTLFDETAIWKQILMQADK
ncbi:MAG: nuclear transport factor 2 family protein [Pseudomonadota bacterium]